MPAQKLNADPIRSALYDVIGSYAEGDPQFVKHVGLAREPLSSLTKGQLVPVIDMGPPLSDSEESPADVHGTAVLTSGEIFQIRGFYELHIEEHRSKELIQGRARWKAYCVVPHAKPLREEDGSYAAMRFNCGGFVIEAYADAGIEFIDTDEDHLPCVSLKTLTSAYSWMRRPTWRKMNEAYDMVLDAGKEKWPVVLPGYVLHALDRSDPHAIRHIPYRPQKGDERFPRVEESD